MSKPVCYLLCVILYDFLLLNLNDFGAFDFFIPFFAFLFLCPDKKRVFFWLLGLNLFILFMVASYFINNEIQNAKIIFLRSNLILLLVLSLLFSKDQYFITKALYELKFPQKIIAIMVINSRLFSDFLQKTKQIPKTLKARGVKLTTSFFTYKCYANLIGKNIVASLDLAFEIFNTMKVRGYKDKIAFLHSEKAQFGEIMLLILSVLNILYRIIINL
ncbi:CbiQ family ECF transporter T component [Campylobacter pinnipediorum]|uniref:CbiQ family ECF transporter T component n=1 Tax=Campylobacter pinnipediorum TaxID=1965231 RepID=UPI00084DAC28|nr:CbiQ family ECF transporter T component [Campylobacter pinnipediorum]AQW82129.1 Co/Ni ABC transporter CbiKLMQO, membrane protein CbiQ [Campylobacter pinnipediorum subsp. pinnipediorum]AQW83807.1 Co/Ni ABC transporter CbiKLMQO, membrane protein CbiQ [Campylobacter pinnipediorum subsp. pinnipediorum]OPA75453.1 hypothetical protein BFG05_06160 [Campylobacter pinnipediorum subsp. pinnipediorum]